jgi:glutamate formiminotransferase
LELVRREAERFGVPVVETEIVGLIPEEALVQVAEYYLQLARFSIGQILERRIEEAFRSE